MPYLPAVSGRKKTERASENNLAMCFLLEIPLRGLPFNEIV